MSPAVNLESSKRGEGQQISPSIRSAWLCS